MSNPGPPYSTYAEVPYYRKQWFFWLMYFVMPPVAIALLLFGDVYYQKKGEVKSFGIANRIVAGMIAAFWLYVLFQTLTGRTS
jgi:Na+/glutamate symporter